MVEETLVTVGAMLSITIALLEANDPVSPGLGKVKVAVFPALSVRLRVEGFVMSIIANPSPVTAIA